MQIQTSSDQELFVQPLVHNTSFASVVQYLIRQKQFLLRCRPFVAVNVQVVMVFSMRLLYLRAASGSQTTPKVSILSAIARLCTQSLE